MTFNNDSRKRMEIGARITGVKVTTKSGTANSKHIPSIYIIVEDRLAQEVIDCIFYDEPYLSKKYMISGSWMNQASCLYGFFTYGNELFEGYKIPSLNVLAVNDGDISEKEIKKRQDGIIKGNFLNDTQRNINSKILEAMTSFNLEHKPAQIKGLPEYNHKKWFEEISEASIEDYEKSESRLIDKNSKYTLLELIDYSKSILPDEKNTNFHFFYNELKKFSPRNTDHRMSNIVYYVLTSIKKYNKSKWDFYTGTIKERIINIKHKNQDEFKKSNFDFC